MLTASLNVFNNIWKSRDHLFLFSVICIIFSAVLAKSDQDVFRRFEYKLSFKGPHLVLKDGTIPFWEHSGSAIASDESVRITPSLKSKKGAIWCKEKNTYDHWQVEVLFRINGRGRIGADGLAVWYRAEQGQDGPVFGSSDKWNGLGVFFDSFDNDAQHNNPYVMAMVNDGTKEYDHEADGSSQQLGGCLRDFRNRPFPVRVKIEYYKRALTIYFHNGLSNNEEDYEMCMRVEDVSLPQNGHFGVSAATGGLADDHDVIAFVTHRLIPPSESGTSTELPESERQRIEKEYDEYREKLDKAREEYRKEHPKTKTDDIDEEKVFESQDSRELRLMFEGQNEISRLVKSTLAKLDEIVGRQERQLSMLTMISQNKQAQPQQGHTIEKRDLDGLSNAQRIMSEDVRDLKHVMNDMNTKVSNFRVPESSGSTKELQDHLASLQTEIKLLGNHLTHVSSQSSSCVTITYLGLFLLLHYTAVIGYLIYRARKESAAKKFY